MGSCSHLQPVNMWIQEWSLTGIDAGILGPGPLEPSPNVLPLTGVCRVVALHTVSQQLHWAFLKFPGKPVAPAQLICVSKVCPGRLAGSEMALLVISHCGD